VKLVINTGRSVAPVARELGTNEATLGPWVNSFKARQDAGDGALSETERAELARLRKENSELKWFGRARIGVTLRPGSLGYEREAVALMHAEKSNFSIARMARLLEVFRSGFYAWLSREPSAPALRAERIEAKIAWYHGKSDGVSGSYGPWSICPRTATSSPARPSPRRCAASVCAASAPQTAHHDDRRSRRRLPARRPGPALGRRDVEPRLGRWHHLPAHL